MNNKKTMSVFHSPIAGAMMREKRNIPHSRNDLGQKGDTLLKEGYNITSYFPNRRQRRSMLITHHVNNRPLTNKRGVSSRMEFLQKIFYTVKDTLENKIKNIIHKNFSL